jgi:hypothetical protein
MLATITTFSSWIGRVPPKLTLLVAGCWLLAAGCWLLVAAAGCSFSSGFQIRWCYNTADGTGDFAHPLYGPENTTGRFAFDPDFRDWEGGPAWLLSPGVANLGSYSRVVVSFLARVDVLTPSPAAVEVKFKVADLSNDALSDLPQLPPIADIGYECTRGGACSSSGGGEWIPISDEDGEEWHAFTVSINLTDVEKIGTYT